MLDLKALGRRIRRLRTARDPRLTQEALAIQMQLRGHDTITQQRIVEIEKGDRSVRAEELVDLARFFDVPISKLLGVPDYARE